MPCGSTTMHPMVTAPICTYSSNDITRAQSRAGEWTASFDFDVALNATPSYPNVIAPNESLADSSLPQCNSTGAFCCNQQYSVTAITTSAGAISERYAYTAYGQPTILNASGTPLSPQTSTLNSRYSYTGREWDATLGVHHFRARWMSPGAGRFLGRDPIGYEGSPYHLYELFDSKPLITRDPSGERSYVDPPEEKKSIWQILCDMRRWAKEDPPIKIDVPVLTPTNCVEWCKGAFNNPGDAAWRRVFCRKFVDKGSYACPQLGRLCYRFKDKQNFERCMTLCHSQCPAAQCAPGGPIN
jgi:RHS repeat-associated protein